MAMRSSQFLKLARSAGRSDWRRLVSPKAPKDVIEGLAKDQAAHAGWLAAASRVPTTIPTIDWAQWKKNIKTPGVVDKLQKEYESMTFAKIDYSHLQKDFKSNEANLADLKRMVPFWKNELVEADKMVKHLEFVKKDSDNWTNDDWIDYYPGLREQYRAEAFEDNVVPTVEEKKEDENDLGEVLKHMRTGEPFTGPIFGAGLPDHFGDVTHKEEHEIIARGEWSIERMHKSKEQRAAIHAKSLKLMGGGVPASVQDDYKAASVYPWDRAKKVEHHEEEEDDHH